MKLSNCHSICLAFLLLFILPACEVEDYDLFQHFEGETEMLKPSMTKSELVPNQYIVLFTPDYVEQLDLATRSTGLSNDPATRQEQTATIQAQYEANIELLTGVSEVILTDNRLPSTSLIQVFSGHQHGMVVNLQDTEIDQLKNDKRIGEVAQDQLIALGTLHPQLKTPFNPASNGSNGNGHNGQITPQGVTRVGGVYDFNANPQYNYRWAWIIDTGIDNHGELDVAFSANFSTDPNSRDGYGHGTHVAGIIAAKNNNKGTVGVAAGASIVNIKVLNSQGTGYDSDVVAALNYASNYLWPEDVINMSIGGNYSNMVDNAVLAIANSGVKVVAAAGNTSQQVNNFSPARVNHPNVFVVSSIGQWDNFSSFSNYGSNVDFAAPGDYILSTYGPTDYAYLTGTSMAAPHVTGVLLIAPNAYTSDGVSTAAPDGRHIPIISR